MIIRSKNKVTMLLLFGLFIIVFITLIAFNSTEQKYKTDCKIELIDNVSGNTIFTNRSKLFNKIIFEQNITINNKDYKLKFLVIDDIYTLQNFWQPLLGFVSGIMFLIFIAYYAYFKSKSEKELKNTKSQLTEAQKIANMGHFTMRIKDMKISCSDEIVRILNLKNNIIDFNTFRELIDEHDMVEIDDRLAALITNTVQPEGELECKAFVEDRNIFMRIKYRALYENEKLKEIFGIAQDITTQKELEHQIYSQKEHFKVLATTDYLTKIYNRVYVSDFLMNLIHQHRRYGHVFSIVLLDIDHFKNVNDTYGHLEGDNVLVEISNHIKTVIRETDIFARWGGEEFLLILSNTDLTNATWVAENLKTSISKLNIHNDYKITCSFGVTDIKEGDTSDSLLQRVDSNLYTAKGLGRNRVIAG